jgi:hypothetical protein
LRELFVRFFSFEHDSTPRQHNKTDERNAAIFFNEYLGVQAPLLLAIDDHQVQPILERLQRHADRLFDVHVLLQITATHVDLAARRPLGDLAGRERLDELAFFLTVLEGSDFAANDMSDEIAKSGFAALTPWIQCGREGNREILKQGLLAPQRFAHDGEHDRPSCSVRS